MTEDELTRGEKRNAHNLRIMKQWMRNLETAMDLLSFELGEENPANIETNDKGEEMLTTFALRLQDPNRHTRVLRLTRPQGGITAFQQLDDRGKILDLKININHKPYIDDSGEACSVTEHLGSVFQVTPVCYYRETVYGGCAVEELIHDIGIRCETEIDECDYAECGSENENTLYMNVDGGAAEEGVEIGSIEFFKAKILELKEQFTAEKAHAPIKAVRKNGPAG
jgi:hypothetical protein